MAITKKPQPKPSVPLPPTQFGGQMATALQKFIERAPDGVDSTSAAPVESDSVQITLRVSRDDLARYDETAKRQGMTRSAFIKRAAILQLEVPPTGFLRQEISEPDDAGEESLRLRTHLMKTLKMHLTRLHVTQAQAAEMCGVSQPRISDLLRGKVKLFGLDALVNMASAAGMHVDMRLMVRM